MIRGRSFYKVPDNRKIQERILSNLDSGMDVRVLPADSRISAVNPKINRTGKNPKRRRGNSSGALLLGLIAGYAWGKYQS